jgi:hypothetical protein
MRNALVFSILALALVAPAGAQPAAGMAAMQYYVGTWSCLAGPPGQPPQKATATYTADSGILRQWVSVPAQGKMTKAYALASSLTYDAKNQRYVSDSLDNTNSWGVSYVTMTGNTEHWMDHATSDGKLGHATLVRTNKNSFALTGYSTPTGTKADFHVACTRAA